MKKRFILNKYKKFFENPVQSNESVPLNQIYKYEYMYEKLKTQKDFFKFESIIGNIDNTKSHQINIKFLDPETNFKKIVNYF